MIGVGIQAGRRRADHGPDDFELRCDVCSATWVGAIGEPCGWCADQVSNLEAEQRRLDRSNGVTRRDIDEQAVTSWHPVDLTEALTGVDVPAPTVLQRSDGLHLLYAGRTHVFAGESESCKSWAAQIAVAEQLTSGHHVLYLDFEDDERGVIGRLRSLGVDARAILNCFVYVRPDEPLRTRDGRSTGGDVEFSRLLKARRWVLVVIDGVTESMVTEGLDLMSNADVATWSRRIPKRCASDGAAVVMLDHVTKSTETRGRYSIGAQHKLAGLTGAQFVFDVLRPLSRARLDPVEGVVKITVTKDRPGHVRTAAVDGVVGLMTLTSYPDGGVTAHIDPPGADAGFDPRLCKLIAEHLSTYPGSSKNGIERDVQGKAEALRLALHQMVQRGWVEVSKVGVAHRHTLTALGIDELL